MFEFLQFESCICFFVHFFSPRWTLLNKTKPNRNINETKIELRTTFFPFDVYFRLFCFLEFKLSSHSRHDRFIWTIDVHTYENCLQCGYPIKSMRRANAKKKHTYNNCNSIAMSHTLQLKAIPSGRKTWKRVASAPILIYRYAETASNECYIYNEHEGNYFHQLFGVSSFRTVAECFIHIIWLAFFSCVYVAFGFDLRYFTVLPFVQVNEVHLLIAVERKKGIATTKTAHKER